MGAVRQPPQQRVGLVDFFGGVDVFAAAGGGAWALVADAEGSVGASDATRAWARGGHFGVDEVFVHFPVEDVDVGGGLS